MCLPVLEVSLYIYNLGYCLVVQIEVSVLDMDTT